MSSQPTTTSSAAPRGRRRIKPPFWLVSILIILVIASWIPLAVIARARVSKSPLPRIQLIQDMDRQPVYKTQQTSPVFSDGRAMRMPIAGTVGRGDLRGSDNYVMGYTLDDKGQPQWAVDFPQEITVDDALLQRGRQRYDIYCLPCHGADGIGDGPVNQRAVELRGSWIPAANLVDAAIRERPAGHLFNTISRGIRSMPPYGEQLPHLRDRWAIVAYVRALQVSHDAPINLLPAKLKQRAQADQARQKTGN
ncbi:MAG: cytochrome c [Phycisphaerales bacterium]|nr:cytochrome c [Phycisphaerales bacterium]